VINKFKTLFTEAHTQINKADAAKEALKVATFRVGSSGALTSKGMYSPPCGRLAQARYLGFQSPPTEEMRVMFNGGTTLEDFITARLKTLKLKFRQEQEFNIEIAPGIPVSGRPDFEIKIGKEWVGLEVKSLASPFSVIKQRKKKDLKTLKSAIKSTNRLPISRLSMSILAELSLTLLQAYSQLFLKKLSGFFMPKGIALGRQKKSYVRRGRR